MPKKQAFTKDEYFELLDKKLTPVPKPDGRAVLNRLLGKLPKGPKV